MSNYQLSVKKYSVYKDSGVEWLGYLPEHWEIYHLKNIVSTKITDGPHETPIFTDDGVPFVSAEAIQNGGINFDSIRGYISQETDKIYSLKCKPKRDDIFIVKSGSTTGKIGYVSTDINFNIWSPLALVRPNKINYPLYVSYFLSSSLFQKQVQMNWSFGTQPNIGMKVLENLQVVCPPLSEQKSIANYLDIKTAQCDRKIDLLTQKATQYGKLKQSLINATVTRGLDKSVPMKDSAIGEIPRHWAVKRLKDLSDIQNSNVDKKSYDDEIPVKLCNYVDVYKNEFIDSSLNFMEATATKSEIKQFTIKKGDIFITKDSETCDDIAIPALATESLDGVLCGYHLARFRMKEKIFWGSYLFRLFQSKSYGFRFVISAKGITRVGLGQSAIADSLTPVPPLSEQKAIADYLDTKTAQIDQIIQTINAQIEKLKELRKTLINDVITGKIKVTGN